MPHLVRLVLVSVLVALICASCRIGIEVAVDVEDDGSGTVFVQVELDQSAAEQSRGLTSELRIADLEQSGWVVTGPDRTEGNGLLLIAEKRFTEPDQLQQVLDEVTGANGMFRNFELTRTAEFAEKRFRLDGEINLDGGIELFNDPEITELLGGDPFGRPVDELLPEGETIDDVVSLTVSMRLPGETEDGVGARGEWTPRFASSTSTTVAIEALEEVFIARLLRWVATAAIALFALSALLGIAGWLLERRARRMRPRVRQPEPMANRIPGAAAAAGRPGEAGTAPRLPTQGSRSSLRLVVLDPRGVLYEVGSSPQDLLLPFVRDNGGETPADEVLEAHHEATLGRITSAELWQICGIEGDPLVIDEAYLELVNPRAGAPEFLREMQRREMAVTALTNDVGSWSRSLRNRDNLNMIWPWIISADVGARKPDPGLFEALRRETNVPYENCLFIDTNLENLDTAKTLGMATAYFADERPSPHSRPSHPVVTNFGDFFRRRS